jgi:2-hydroxychromene-2-carboxylate isomerase
MKTITCYLDFISPYAYLAFEAAPQSLMGVSHRMVYKPVLFAAMLKHHGQLGPAEIAGKREWTYRQVLWQAKQLGIPMDMPAMHPFNPLALLRLALACGREDLNLEPNRYVCETIFRHVWQGGAVADDAKRLQALTEQLNPSLSQASLDDEAVKEKIKAQLKANTDEAIARGVFGVPTFAVDDKLFWGLDALPMLRAYLDGDQWFEQHWDASASIQQGVKR